MTRHVAAFAAALLLAVGVTAAQPAQAAPTAEAVAPIVVHPSGCISIIPERRAVDPYPWWYYNSSISWWDSSLGIWHRQLAYRIRQAPYPNEFIGATDIAGLSLIWQAPAGAPNVINRSLNCMLSGGRTQG